MNIEIFDQYKLESGHFDDQAVNITLNYHDFQMIRNKEELKRDIRISEFPEKIIHFTVKRDVK